MKTRLLCFLLTLLLIALPLRLDAQPAANRSQPHNQGLVLGMEQINFPKDTPTPTATLTLTQTPTRTSSPTPAKTRTPIPTQPPVTEKWFFLPAIQRP